MIKFSKLKRNLFSFDLSTINDYYIFSIRKAFVKCPRCKNFKTISYKHIVRDVIKPAIE